MNNILCKEILHRYSCRLFDNSRIVPDEILSTLLIAASMAPSGKNLQPWRFRIVEDAGFSNRLAEILPNNKWVKNVRQFILVFLDTSYSYDNSKDSMAIGACVENLLIEAAAQSVDTCWIGECTDYVDFITNLLDVGAQYKLMSIIAVGYSKMKSKKVAARKLLTELLI